MENIIAVIFIMLGNKQNLNKKKSRSNKRKTNRKQNKDAESVHLDLSDR